MNTYEYSFKVESQSEHETAQDNYPSSTRDESGTTKHILTANPGTIIEGAKIEYDPNEPVKPRFGPVNELPPLSSCIRFLARRAREFSDSPERKWIGITLRRGVIEREHSAIATREYRSPQTRRFRLSAQADCPEAQVYHLGCQADNAQPPRARYS